MSQILRQSTQVVVHIGPFVDVTDGFTPEVGITLGAADEAEAVKGGSTTTTDISAATWAAITGCDGWYALTLTTSHTDTIGTLTIMVNDDSVCLPVFARFQVIEEAAYDTIFAASALPASTTNITAGTITTATNVTTVNGLAAGVITAAAVATGAIDADALAADAVAEIADGVWDEDATGHQTQGTFGQAIGDPVADTNTIYKAVVTDAAGATVGVDIVAVQADTDNIQTRLPAALVSGRMDSSVGAMAADVITAASMAADAGTEIAAAVWNEDATAHQTLGTFGQAIGDPVADANTIYAAVVTGAAGATVAADIIAVKADTAAILVDTTEIGVAGAGLTAIDLPDQTMNITGNITGNISGSVGSVTGAVGSVAGNVVGSVGSLAAQAKADVNAEVVDALNVDTYAEPGQGTPAATTTLVGKLGYLYKAWRNKSDQTATLYQLYNDDAATVDQKSTVSDDATTFTKGEIATGP